MFVILFKPCNLFAGSYKIIVQQGTVSVIVNRADSDISSSLPDRYFLLETKENSYVVIQGNNATLILMSKSKLIFSDGVFILESGYLYSKSIDENPSLIKISNNDVTYSILGVTFALWSQDGIIRVLSNNIGVKIISDKSVGLTYVLHPYSKASIFPWMSSPSAIFENERALIVSVANRLDMELIAVADRDIQRHTFKIFENTRYATDVYRVVHSSPGKNIFIIVPHGNERAGTAVARERVGIPIKSGSLTIVPVAVSPSYSNNSRTINGEDINRKFVTRRTDKTMVDQLATKYMQMLREYKIDVVLTLHEGNGYEEFFGDAIIYDDENLASIVGAVLNRVNPRIEIYKYKFKQMHYPMPTTLTYYANSIGIDAFGIELTQALDFEIKRIIMHAIIDEFFKVYDIK